MINKPFRPPLLDRVDRAPAAISDTHEERHAKKRRIDEDGQQSGPTLVFKKPGISSLPRKPLLPVINSAGANEIDNSLTNEIESYYNVLWYGKSFVISVGSC